MVKRSRLCVSKLLMEGDMRGFVFVSVDLIGEGQTEQEVLEDARQKFLELFNGSEPIGNYLVMDGELDEDDDP